MKRIENTGLFESICSLSKTHNDETASKKGKSNISFIVQGTCKLLALARSNFKMTKN